MKNHSKSHFEGQSHLSRRYAGKSPLGCKNVHLTDNVTLTTQIGRELQERNRSVLLQGDGTLTETEAKLAELKKRVVAGDDQSLAELRHQITGADSPSAERAGQISANLNDEESLRRNLSRERRLRLKDQAERLGTAKGAMNRALQLEHQSILTNLESEMREIMESELSRLEKETLSREEEILREELDMRLEREEISLKEQLEVERERRLSTSREQLQTQLSEEMGQEFDRRRAFLQEKMEIEATQALQEQLSNLESELKAEMEAQLKSEEDIQSETIESEQQARLAEREIQLRDGIRRRLEQQLRSRLRAREARLRSEYEHRAHRLEEEIAKDLQDELEQRLTSETDKLEERMQQDLELAVARKRDEVRSSILSELEKQYGERIAERKQRLRERYDLTFSQSIDEIEHALNLELEETLDSQMSNDFEAYRRTRESEISSRLARFRHDREIELREQLSSSFESRKQEWIDQLEQEFRAKESAVQRQIMAEIDARVRNEKISQETSLDLLKQETAMELEVEMEARLREFRGRKEEEVTDQLERQLAKREEIMRNKALIEVRRRESEIRAEIEAQLSVKRTEIRERLATLEQRSEEFKQVAEEKIRGQLERNLVSEEDLEDEIRLKQMEDEVDNLESQDDVLARRERWMGALKGAQGQMPEAATDKLGGLRGGGRLGQPGAARLGLGSQAAVAPDSPKLAGSRLAPARAPIGQKAEPAPISQPTTTIPRAKADSGLADRLTPVRPPVKVDSEPEKPRSLSDIAQEEIVSQGEEPDQKVLDDQLSPLTEIAEKDDWDDEETDDVEIVTDTSQMLEKVSRGPPGGGALVRTPPQDDAPTPPTSKRGPPGGGRLVRDEAPILDISRRPSEDDSESKQIEILTPVRRPVLQPKSAETATLRPVKTSVKILSPSTASEVAKLTPVKPTLTPVEAADQEEE